jgi:hopanoid biosynthesis associated RND transporter like protein HpnN
LAELTRRAAAFVVAGSVLATIAAGWYAIEHLSIQTDTGAMFSSDVPFRKNQDDFNRAFPQFVDALLVVVDAPTRGRAEDVARALSERIAAETALVRSVEFARGDPFFRRNGLLYLDVGRLERLSLALAEAQPLLATLHGDPTLRGLGSILSDVSRAAAEGQAEIPLAPVYRRFAEVVESSVAGKPHTIEWQTIMGGASDADSEDDPVKRVVVVIQPKLNFSTLLPAKELIGKIRAARAALPSELKEGTRVRITGSPVLANDEVSSARNGAEISAALSLVAIAIILTVALGSFSLVLASVWTLVMGLIWTAAFAAAAVGHLNLISVAFVVLFIGVGGDFSILWTLRVREELNRGLGLAAAIRAAALGTGEGLVLGALTAAAGFLAFVPTGYLGLAELGIISGAGMFIGLLLTVTVMPAMVALIPPHPRPQRLGEGTSASLSAWIRRHAGPLVIGSAALGIAGVVLSTRAFFDYNPINLRDPHAEATIAFRDLSKSGSTSPYTISALAADLEGARALAARLETLPTVDRAITLASYVPEKQEEKLKIVDDMGVFLAPLATPAPNVKPLAAGEGARVVRALLVELDKVAKAEGTAAELRRESARLASALRAHLDKYRGSDASLNELGTRLIGDLPRRLEDLAQMVEPRKIALNDLPELLRESMIARDDRMRIEIRPKEDMTDDAALKRFVREVQAVAPQATGAPVIALGAGDAVLRAFAVAGAVAFIAITIVVLAMLRNFLDYLLVLAPLALAALLTVGTTVLIDEPFNFANVIVLPLLLGTEVAGATHIVLWWRREGGPASQRGISTPNAVLFASLTTFASFGTLALSEHPGMASMGVLLTVAIFFTIFSTLVFLPALLQWVHVGLETGKKSL